MMYLPDDQHSRPDEQGGGTTCIDEAIELGDKALGQGTFLLSLCGTIQ